MSLLRIKQADGSWENIPAIKGADGLDGKDGAIQYTAGRYIQIDEDTQTINCTVKIGDLVIIDAVPVKDSTNVVSSGGVYDALETKADKTDIAELGSEAGFITNSVEDLRNYYKKSETYSQEEVNSLLGNLTRLTLQVVQELPEVGTEHVIYLVPNGESGNNVFEEWIFIQSKWEMIGTTEVDLTGYATKKYVDDAVANVVAGNEGPDLNNYYTKEEIDALMPTEDELTRMPYITVSYSLNNSDSIRELEKVFTEHYKKHNNINTLMFGIIDYNASYIKILRWKNNGTGEGGIPTTVYFNAIHFSTSNIVDTQIWEYFWRFSFDSENNISIGPFTATPISTLTNSFLSKSNTTEFTPTSDYNPATKKYVDDAVANAGGGSGEGVDLTNYYNKEEVDAKVAPLVSATDVLTKTNTTEYTPASAYHPATKQYVDQTVASSGAITEESDPTVPLHVKNITQDMITKWNNAPTDEDVTNAATAAVNGAGFVKTETDPAFKASAAAGIASSDIDNWNGKADLADIDSALISTLGGTYSTNLVTNPIYNTTEITMTEELLELATNIKDAIAAGNPPKITLKVTFNNSTEDLHFIPKDYNVDEGYCRYIAPVYNHKDDNDFRSFSCSILLAQLRFYNLNATNKNISIYYEDATNLHTINEANWVNGSLTENSTPEIGLGLYTTGSNLSLVTTLDLAYLSHSHNFKVWSGNDAPTTSRDRLVLGMLGNKLLIDFGYNGTSFTKGFYQTFSEMMEAIKVTDESSDDYGKYILAENFLTIDSSWWDHYNLNGRRLIDEHGYYSNIIYAYYNDNYDRVYLRGSQSGEIIVAKLVANNSYSYNGSINNNHYRVTLEIDPEENKALLNSTTDLGKIQGMTSKQTFDCDAGDGLLPTVYLDSDGYIERVSFTQVDFR